MSTSPAGTSEGREGHTPGPWTADGTDIVGPGGRNVAECWVRTPSGAEAMANARLIAAAPELLAALRALLPIALVGTAQYVSNEIIAARRALSRAVDVAGGE